MQKRHDVHIQYPAASHLPRTSLGKIDRAKTISRWVIFFVTPERTSSGFTTGDHTHRFYTITGKGFRPRVLDIGRWRYITLIYILTLPTLVTEQLAAESTHGGVRSRTR